VAQPLQGPLIGEVSKLNRDMIAEIKNVLTVDEKLTVNLQRRRQLAVCSRCLEPQPQNVGCQLLTLRVWVHAGISTRGHPSGRERWVTTSSALCLLGRLDRAGYAGRPRLCRGWSACLEHFRLMRSADCRRYSSPDPDDFKRSLSFWLSIVVSRSFSARWM